MVPCVGGGRHARQLSARVHNYWLVGAPKPFDLQYLVSVVDCVGVGVANDGADHRADDEPLRSAPRGAGSGASGTEDTDNSVSQPPDAVLNGIAWDAENRRMFVTGKLWPALYEIRLVETDAEVR